MCSYQHFSFIFIVHTSVEWNSLNNNSIKYCMACVSVGTQNNSAENMIRFNTIWQDKLSVACWTIFVCCLFRCCFSRWPKKRAIIWLHLQRQIYVHIFSREQMFLCVATQSADSVWRCSFMFTGCDNALIIDAVVCFSGRAQSCFWPRSFTS